MIGMIGRTAHPSRVQAGVAAPYAERNDPARHAVDAFLANIGSRFEAGLLQRWRLRQVGRIADQALSLEASTRALGRDGLRTESALLRERLVAHGLRPELVARAFALAREATRRHLGLAHHRVQLMGGAAMLGRRLAEMETGEGKTITALLPAALFALAGRPVHVVTVNDYLARRDAEQLKPVYAELGIGVGVVAGGMGTEERRAAYREDVIYCTNKDLVFDYLRDRRTLGSRRSHHRMLVDQLVGPGWEAPTQAGQGDRKLFLRGLHVAIVDEADSVMIDEARTPLILSEQIGGEDDNVLYAAALDLARRLEPGIDYIADQKRRQAFLTASGRARLAELSLGLEGLWRVRRAREELAEKALLALQFFHSGTQYVIAEGKVQIVDEFTGRVMPDRTWEHGLHQMVEAKEGCEISGCRRTIAKITFQRFFSRYGHLCGMTGTAAESRAELAATYDLGVLRIPRHARSRRTWGGVLLTDGPAAKWDFVVQQSRTLIRAGRAVLIGTRSVGASEAVADRLRAAGLSPAVLNAQQSREEAMIVARAGQPGALTVATNMAGRGTDIRLNRSVRERGGLHVILTEFHESARIDRQLFGRCGRQNDPGSVEAVVAIDDEVFRRFAGPLLIRLASIAMRARPLRGWPVQLLVRVVQGRAERMNSATRRQTVKHGENIDRSLAFGGRSE